MCTFNHSTNMFEWFKFSYYENLYCEIFFFWKIYYIMNEREIILIWIGGNFFLSNKFGYEECCYVCAINLFVRAILLKRIKIKKRFYIYNKFIDVKRRIRYDNIYKNHKTNLTNQPINSVFSSVSLYYFCKPPFVISLFIFKILELENIS